jgi:isopropylmalate/homocitrate/citramalate synthase
MHESVVMEMRVPQALHCVVQFTIDLQRHKKVHCAPACFYDVQDGMLKSRDTYEIMTPESVGLSRNPDDAGELPAAHVIALAEARLGA